MIRPPPTSTLFPYTTLFRSSIFAYIPFSINCLYLLSARVPTSAVRNTFRGASGKTMEPMRSEEHTSELQSRRDLVCRLLLEKKKKKTQDTTSTTDVCEYTR